MTAPIPSQARTYRCVDCGITVPPRYKRCPVHAKAVHRIYWKRYRQSPKGRARRDRYLQSPKHKLAAARYVEAHPAIVARSRMHQNNARRTGPTIRQCATERCTRTFKLNGPGNARKFCKSCQFCFGLIPANGKRRQWAKLVAVGQGPSRRCVDCAGPTGKHGSARRCAPCRTLFRRRRDRERWAAKRAYQVAA